MPFVNRFGLVVLAIALGFWIAHHPAAAQSWPQRTVRVIVPLGPGSAVDLDARLFSERLAKRWGQPVVVENLPGADAIVAINTFNNSRDNHTLFFSFGGPVTINPVVYEKLSYDPARDLVPIASAAEHFLAIAVPTSLNVNSLDELVKLAKAQPGKLNWAATPGQPQFILEGFLKSAGLDMVHVTYREFRTAFTDLGEGRIQVALTSLTGFAPSIQAGKVKPLVVTNRQRSPDNPAVPTGVEAGYPVLAAEGLAGFFGWRDIPNELRERISADVREVGKDLELSRRLVAAGQVVRVGTPAEFEAVLKEQREMIERIAKLIDLKPKQ
jgi:tripartite-type tricarboxylate transporter receptor subunit TctC